MNTFYRKVLHVALVSRKGGSISPEEGSHSPEQWLHFDPNIQVEARKLFSGTIMFGSVHANSNKRKQKVGS